jgi:hypothetical protein
MNTWGTELFPTLKKRPLWMWESTPEDTNHEPWCLTYSRAWRAPDNKKNSPIDQTGEFTSIIQT